MAAEQIAWAWIKSEILTPNELLFKPTNTYYEACRCVIEGADKKGYNKHD
jgi:hypothetical protein